MNDSERHPTDPERQSLPPEGFLEDDFAHFRERRLCRGKLQPPPPETEPDSQAEALSAEAEDASSPAETRDDEGTLFFGTTPRERNRLRARDSVERLSRRTDRLRVERFTRLASDSPRPSRRRPPPLPLRRRRGDDEHDAA